MYVSSSCELPVSSLIWQPQPSVWTLTVICRATFRLLPTESVLLPGGEQEAPYERDDHWNDDEARSLRVASDLVPLKPRADVTLIGHAFAPNRTPTRGLVARLLVGEVDKAIEVCADRAFDQEGKLHEGPRFVSMPLMYERAAGGLGTANPVGMRGTPDTYGRIAVPNLQVPGTRLSSPSAHLSPIGFGPLAPGWPARREKRGRALSTHDLLQQPLPPDLDSGYWNHAPRDQQLQLLRDTERIVLENLHPEHPRFVTSLPGTRPRAIIEQKGTTEVVPLRCDTLWIDTDQMICALTWRLQIPLEHPQQPGQVSITLNAPPAAPSLTLTDDDAPDTVKPSAAKEKAALPFARSAPPPSPSRPDDKAGLPFARSAPPPPPPPRSEDKAGRAGGLPFVARPSGVMPAPVPPGGSFPQAVMPAPVIPAPVMPAPVMPAPVMPVVEARPQAMTVGQRAAQESGVVETAREAPARPAEEAVRPVAKLELGRALHLIWFDPECLPRVRRKRAFRSLLEKLEGRPLDADLDDPALAKDPMAVEDRRDVFEVLARGAADDEIALQEAMEKAMREDGKFVPPLVLTQGELRLPFDELEALRATLSIAGAFAAGDEPLRTAITEGREYLDTPNLLAPPSVTEGFTTRVVEAFRRARRAVSPGYLEEQAERVLVEKRHYQRREVFGGPHLRALLTVGTAPKPWPTYIPAPVAAKLPLFARFPVRLLADACLQEDGYESHAAALRVVALARTAPAPGKGGDRPAKDG